MITFQTNFNIAFGASLWCESAYHIISAVVVLHVRRGPQEFGGSRIGIVQKKKNAARKERVAVTAPQSGTSFKGTALHLSGTLFF